MGQFDYRTAPQQLLTPEIVNAVSAIHEYRGKQELYLARKPEVLESLREVARVQSTDASNRIEGIATTGQRLGELVAGKATPRNRNEEEIAGYRDVLALIHDSHDYIDISPSVILQLHRNLYRHTSASFGGQWKNSDNVIAGLDEEGNQVVRFRPTPAVATPQAMTDLCTAFNDALRDGVFDPLLLICLFVFDFVSIHPFNDGNGRMSRLLTLLLLYRSGYLVGKYVSIEKAIEATKATYYDALQDSSAGWTEGAADYRPFTRYLLGVILSSYRTFDERVAEAGTGGAGKAARVRSAVERSLGKVTKAEIQAQVPDISQTTVERVLSEMVKEGALERMGAGRGASYRKARQP